MLVHWWPHKFDTTLTHRYACDVQIDAAKGVGWGGNQNKSSIVINEFSQKMANNNIDFRHFLLFLSKMANNGLYDIKTPSQKPLADW